MDEKRSFAVPVAASLLFLLLFLYVVAYVATVERMANFAPGFNPTEWAPEYRIGKFRSSRFVDKLFHPVHALDRMVRHEHWSDLQKRDLKSGDYPYFTYYPDISIEDMHYLAE